MDEQDRHIRISLLVHIRTSAHGNNAIVDSRLRPPVRLCVMVSQIRAAPWRVTLNVHHTCVARTIGPIMGKYGVIH